MYLPLLLTFLYLLPLNISPSCLSSVVFPLLAALPLINSFACFPSLLSRNCLSFIFLILLHLLLILLFLSSSPTIVTFSSFFIYFLSISLSYCTYMNLSFSDFFLFIYSFFSSLFSPHIPHSLPPLSFDLHPFSHPSPDIFLQFLFFSFFSSYNPVLPLLCLIYIVLFLLLLLYSPPSTSTPPPSMMMFCSVVHIWSKNKPRRSILLYDKYLNT